MHKNQFAPDRSGAAYSAAPDSYRWWLRGVSPPQDLALPPQESHPAVSPADLELRPCRPCVSLPMSAPLLVVKLHPCLWLSTNNSLRLWKWYKTDTSSVKGEYQIVMHSIQSTFLLSATLEKYYYFNTTNIFTLTFQSLSETFIRRSLFKSSSGSCHDSDATWQEIGRTCGSACSCPRPGSKTAVLLFLSHHYHDKYRKRNWANFFWCMKVSDRDRNVKVKMLVVLK